jgi:SET domain-containing protein
MSTSQGPGVRVIGYNAERFRAAVRGDVESSGVPSVMIERRRSKLHGWGVFATARIPKNKRIIHYAGEKITHRESAIREAAYLKQGRIWCFWLNTRWVIDAGVGGNDARFINHSCTPNCYVQVTDGVIWIRAAKTIEPGEELTYNYRTDGEKSIACRCRAGCPTRL